MKAMQLTKKTNVAVDLHSLSASGSESFNSIRRTISVNVFI